MENWQDIVGISKCFLVCRAPGHSTTCKYSPRPHCPFMYSQCMSLTPNSLGHFRDVTKANLLAWYGKTKPDTTKPGIYQSKEMYTVSQKTSHLWLAITLTHINGF